MSEQSNKLITEVAKAEHQKLQAAVVRAAKAWRYAQDGKLAREALASSVDVLTKFEDRHRDRLNA